MLPNSPFFCLQGFNLKANSQNCSGSLLHLPRFFTEHKSKMYYLTEKVVEFLKTKPNFMAEYDAVRNEIGGTSTPKKLFKTPDFLRFVKSEVSRPFCLLGYWISFRFLLSLLMTNANYFPESTVSDCSP